LWQKSIAASFDLHRNNNRRDEQQNCEKNMEIEPTRNNNEALSEGRTRQGAITLFGISTALIGVSNRAAKASAGMQ